MAPRSDGTQPDHCCCSPATAGGLRTSAARARWTLKATLTGRWSAQWRTICDWEDATEAGIHARPGSADRVAVEMSAAERQELARLLEDELKRTGA